MVYSESQIAAGSGTVHIRIQYVCQWMDPFLTMSATCLVGYALVSDLAVLHRYLLDPENYKVGIKYTDDSIIDGTVVSLITYGQM